MIKLVPKAALPIFARTWGGLLEDAVRTGSLEAWTEALMFPKCALLAPPPWRSALPHQRW
jgi:hypothetical protein